jgi:hypothetical protein
LFLACEKLKPLIPLFFFATKAKYNLCTRQFDCGPNLAKIIDERGKRPFLVPWQSETRSLRKLL